MNAIEQMIEGCSPDDPPTREFLERMGLTRASIAFGRRAWKYAHEVRRPFSLTDVRKLIQEEGLQ